MFVRVVWALFGAIGGITTLAAFLKDAFSAAKYMTYCFQPNDGLLAGSDQWDILSAFFAVGTVFAAILALAFGGLIFAIFAAAMLIGWAVIELIEVFVFANPEKELQNPPMHLSPPDTDLRYAAAEGMLSLQCSARRAA